MGEGNSYLVIKHLASTFAIILTTHLSYTTVTTPTLSIFRIPNEGLQYRVPHARVSLW